MLREILIKNFAIIDELSVKFKKGLNIITGETGTGKSIIIDALVFVLGGKAEKTIVKTGAKKAVVEALFQIKKESIPNPEEWGIDFDDEHLIIKRE